MGFGHVAYLAGGEQYQQPDEDDDATEASNLIFKSQQECTHCGDTILYTDELFLLELQTAKRFEENPMGCELLVDEEGDFMFPPYLLHLECWESILEEIREKCEDKPPTNSTDPVLICTVCCSMIGHQEVFVLASFGEVHASQRRPTDEVTDQFNRIGAPTCVCLECIVSVIDECLPDWDDLPDYMPEYAPMEPDDE